MHCEAIYDNNLQGLDNKPSKADRAYTNNIFDPLYKSLAQTYEKTSTKPSISLELLKEIQNTYRLDAQRIDKRCFGKQKLFEKALEQGEGIVTTPKTPIPPEEIKIHLAYADFIKKSLPKLLAKTTKSTEKETL